ncbi:MAG: hypothetical protein HY427_00275 [Candidatus Levybacteria bacterium]|nr:hypothetical protein [Candidatus Levybacteria bacterium]
MRWAAATAAAIILTAMVAFAFALTIDRGPSYTETPSVLLAVTSEDVVSPLAAMAGSSVATTTDSYIAIASKTATDNGILTTSGLLLLAAIGAIYLIQNYTGRLRHLARSVRRASRGIGMSAFNGYGKFRVIAEKVFTAPMTTLTNTTTRTPTRARVITFLRSHGGEAYARSIAFLAVMVIGALVQVTRTSIH